MAFRDILLVSKSVKAGRGLLAIGSEDRPDSVGVRHRTERSSCRFPVGGSCRKHGHYRVTSRIPRSEGSVVPGQVPGMFSGSGLAIARKESREVAFQTALDMAGKAAPEMAATRVLRVAFRSLPGMIRRGAPGVTG